MDRRTFIKSSAILGAGLYLPKCGESRPEDSTIDSGELILNNGAVASSQAKRLGNATKPEPPSQKWLPGQFITHVDVDSRRMAFTFDDGPSPYNTLPILQTLARYSIKATFYLIGVNVQSWPDIARQIADEGHEIGNHSVYHSPYASVALANQIGPNQQIIQNATGIIPVTNRAPGLTKGKAILNACRAHGLYETHTHKDTNDWRSPRRSASTLVSEFSKYDWTGGIALYHDGGGKRPTPQALPAMIENALSKGFTFHTVTELVNSGTPMPTNGVYASNMNDLSIQSKDLFIDVCNYDVKKELGSRLLELTNRPNPKNKTEINRIKEALDNIYELEK